MQVNKVTEEQQHIISLMTNGADVYCNAVAGSGKTHTILQIAKQNQNKIVVQVTYNRVLADEVKAKAENFNNIKVYTYHGLMTRVYGKCHDDVQLVAILKTDKRPRINNFTVDIFIMDEAQDLTDNLFAGVVKIFRDFSIKPQLGLFGDEMQSIYQFKGSDKRFLTLAPQVWQRPEMIATRLSITWRMTKNIANFISDIMLQKPGYIRSGKDDGPKVLFISNDKKHKYDSKVEESAAEKIVSSIIHPMLESGKYLEEDFYILFPSPKRSKVREKIEGNLVNKLNLTCFVSDSEKSVGRVLSNNKIGLTSFHQVKGCERKVVIIPAFDDSYYKFYAKNYKNYNICPEVLYVAASRAIDLLVIYEFPICGVGRFPFLDGVKLLTHTSVHYTANSIVRADELYLRPKLLDNKLSKTTGDKSDANLTCATDSPHKNSVKEPLESQPLESQPLEEPVDTTSDENEYGAKKRTVTELVRFIQEKYLHELEIYMNKLFIVLQQAYVDIKLPTILEFEKTHEAVAHLIGISIPSLWQQEIEDTCDIINFVRWQKHTGFSFINKNFKEVFYKFYENTQSYYDKLQSDDKDNRLECILRFSNMYDSCANHICHNLVQITDYNWLKYSEIRPCLDQLDNNVDLEQLQIEVPIKMSKGSKYDKYNSAHNYSVINNKIRKILGLDFKKENFKIIGQIDAINHDTVWEIKTTQSLTLEHQLQLVIYAWLCIEVDTDNSRVFKLSKKKFKLLNTRTGEIQELIYDAKIVDEVMRILFLNAWAHEETISDSIFIAKCMGEWVKPSKYAKKSSTVAADDVTLEGTPATISETADPNDEPMDEVILDTPELSFESFLKESGLI